MYESTKKEIKSTQNPPPEIVTMSVSVHGQSSFSPRDGCWGRDRRWVEALKREEGFPGGKGGSCTPGSLACVLRSGYVGMLRQEVRAETKTGQAECEGAVGPAKSSGPVLPLSCWGVALQKSAVRCTANNLLLMTLPALADLPFPGG